MITRAQELCRKLKPVLGRKIDGLWAAYLAESDAKSKADIEQTLELLAAKHLGQGFEPDRSPYPPPSRQFAESGDVPVIVLQLCRKRKSPPKSQFPFARSSSKGNWFFGTRGFLFHRNKPTTSDNLESSHLKLVSFTKQSNAQ